LLAAANALLLKKVISLPTESIRTGVASIDDVVNVLAERALLSTTKQAAGDHHLDELLNTFPKLQYGMDVNPKFTQGVTGVEYTSNLSAFDLLSVDLVHGWLLDPQDTETSTLIGQKTYNELIEVVVHGNEASTEVGVLNKRITEMEKELAELNKEEEGWVNVKNEECAAAAAAAADQGVQKTDDGNDAPSAAESTTASEATTTDSSDAPVLVDEPAKQDDAVTADTTTEENGTTDDHTAAPQATNDTKTDVNTETSSSDTNESSEASLINTDELLSVEERKQKLQTELASLKEKLEKLSTIATNGSLINSFLSSTGHQLTHYGLHELYEYLQEESLCVFFRNNHFGTLTKHKGVLYLLVTDLGYANVPEVMWEKIDGIDGDTEYVNASFAKPAPQAELKPAPGPSLNPEDVLAQRGQVDADMQLALELSKHDTPTRNIDEEEGKLVAAATEASLRTYNGMDDEEECKMEVVSTEETVALVPPGNDGIVDGCCTQEDSDKLIAMQMQAQMDHEDASLCLARKLQEEDRQQAAAAAARTTSTPSRGRPTSSGRSGSSSSDKCVIS